MDDTVPARVREYADQAVEYVRRALGVPIEYDSDTLPLLDHYLRQVATDKPEALALVIATAGAYFGEVVRRRLGGRWEWSGGSTVDGVASGEGEWRVVLPTGLNFSPSGFVASAIAQADLEDHDSELDAPPRMLPYVQQTLGRMGEVSVEEYYSLCGRLDTIEHVHEVLVAIAAQMLGPSKDVDSDEEPVPDVVADEPSGSVN